MDRFWSKVQKTDGCWLWLAGPAGDGYGTFKLNGATLLAHRVSYLLTHGELPDGPGYHGVEIRHTCDVRRCVRPDHLVPGSHWENMQDAAQRKRMGLSSQPGELNAACRFPDLQIAEMRALYAKGGTTQQKIAERFNTTQPVVCNIVNFKKRRVQHASL